MANSTLKLSKNYLDKHPIVTGKQRQDNEAFGRAILSLLFHRAEAMLGDKEDEELIIEVKFKLEPQPLKAGDPCVAVSAVAEEKLDKGITERLMKTHVED